MGFSHLAELSLAEVYLQSETVLWILQNMPHLSKLCIGVQSKVGLVRALDEASDKGDDPLLAPLTILRVEEPDFHSASKVWYAGPEEEEICHCGLSIKLIRNDPDLAETKRILHEIAVRLPSLKQIGARLVSCDIRRWIDDDGKPCVGLDDSKPCVGLDDMLDLEMIHQLDVYDATQMI